MNLDKLKMMKEKLSKVKSQTPPQPPQQQANITQQTEQKVQKQKDESQSVEHKNQPIHQKANAEISETTAPKQNREIKTNTLLYQKLMSLKSKNKEKSESNTQKEPQKVQQPILQVEKKLNPVIIQNNQEKKNEAKSKQLSLKQLREKLKKPKSEQNIPVQAPPQAPKQPQVLEIQHKPQPQPQVIQNQQEKQSLGQHLVQAGVPQVITQQLQVVIKSSSALDQGQRFPWAKSFFIPVCQNDLLRENNESKNRVQNPVEQILEIIKKSSQQILAQNYEPNQPQHVQEQEQRQGQLIVQQQNIESNKEERLIDPQPIHNIQPKPEVLPNAEPQPQAQSQQQSQPQPQKQSQPQPQAQLQVQAQAQASVQPEPQVQVQVQQHPAIQQEEKYKQKQKPQQQTKVMQKLNAMMQNLRRMKEMKENKNKQIQQANKVSNNSLQIHMKRNQVQEAPKVNVSKTQENMEAEEDLQQEQNLQEEEQQEKHESQKQRHVFCKQQQKRTKIFLKQIIKIGEITQRIRKLISQKYHFEQQQKSQQPSSLVDLFKRVQLAVKK